MKNLRLAAVAVISVVVSSIIAAPAHAYPDSPNITISLPSSELYGGDRFTFTVSSDVECAWTVSYAAGTPPTQTGQGKTFSGTFETQPVDAVFTSPVTATCVYNDESSGVADQTASASANVTLLPRAASGGGDSDSDAGTGNGNENDGQDDVQDDGAAEAADENVADTRNGALPDTGGSNQWVLVLGGVLIVAGGGAVVAARRRHGFR